MRVEHPYIQGGNSDKVGIVVITSNRGLAGGYNSNVVKLVQSLGYAKENVRIYPVGKKGMDMLARKGYEVAGNYCNMIEEPTFDDAKQLSSRLLSDFTKGEIGEIYVAYTEFKNTVVHIPKMVKLLPVDASAVVEDDSQVSDVDRLTLMNFEPSEEEAIGLLIPKYVTSILYGAFVEAVASENGARMQAMDSATNNAEEIINDLELKYNRARQGAITQELTEIIAGADAIG